VKGSSCNITLQWEDWMITIPVVAPLREDLRKQIEANLKSDKPGYWLAAQFYYEYDANNEKALDMINAGIKANETAGRKPYWQYHYKARILKDLGRKQEAIDAAMLSSKYAKEHGNRNNYVKLSEDLITSLKK
jgi:tetratricopeptide (TPR) repeat protein